jgi:hypothetical protein
MDAQSTSNDIISHACIFAQLMLNL